MMSAEEITLDKSDDMFVVDQISESHTVKKMEVAVSGVRLVIKVAHLFNADGIIALASTSRLPDHFSSIGASKGSKQGALYLYQS
jgi:hypothetical protein